MPYSIILNLRTLNIVFYLSISIFSRLAVEVDDAAADEAPAARGGDLFATPSSSGRRRRYSRPEPGTGPGSDTAEPDECRDKGV
ncbi:hypothetical protein C2845_PM14G07920 [Panicum miliaceum]|uniref:Uncharacterized protein n=1 Tax=Panicum miliaceum TaxID=4540 RepID=A0A3L6PLA3_PANMI|nr:hypothetical protein C2845_PM14G07920 [Panicum miliaceum]